MARPRCRDDLLERFGRREVAGVDHAATVSGVLERERHAHRGEAVEGIAVFVSKRVHDFEAVRLVDREKLPRTRRRLAARAAHRVDRAAADRVVPCGELGGPSRRAPKAFELRRRGERVPESLDGCREIGGNRHREIFGIGVDIGDRHCHASLAGVASVAIRSSSRAIRDRHMAS